MPCRMATREELEQDDNLAQAAWKCQKPQQGLFQHRKPLAYKANSVVEYVMLYRKASDRLIG